MAPYAAAETVTLIPVADTSLYDTAPLNNLGGVQSIAVGMTARDETFRGLLKFDPMASIPAGATITGASLEFATVRAPGGAAPAEFSLHRMLVSWGEGNKGAGGVTGTGELATEGEACWSFRFHPGVGWAAPGGTGGLDFVEAPAATASQSQASAPVVFNASPQLAADVQRWLDNPGTNFGWVIKEHAELVAFTARRLGSREHPTDPPRLRIEFSTPFRVGRVEVRGTEICLVFTAQAGKAYSVERRASVDSGLWTPVASLPVAETTEEVSVCEPLGAGNQFYRVAETGQ